MSEDVERRLSTIERAAHIIKTLKAEEWMTLAGLERAAKNSGTADHGMVSRLSALPVERAKFAIVEFTKKDLAGRRGHSFTLTKQGAEVLALHDYVKKDLIFALGAIIAKGKESDVYEVVNEEGSLFALKFFKLGRTSFTRVRKKRFREGSKIRSWMTVNYEAARREYIAMTKLAGLGPAFPKALAYNRSTVLLEHVSGVRLSERPGLSDPEVALKTILRSIRLAYTDAGLVNADLSEYNVLTDGSSFWLIDWPQAVSLVHPNSADLLRHDVGSLVRFFKRAYAVDLEESIAYEYASGASPSLE